MDIQALQKVSSIYRSVNTNRQHHHYFIIFQKKMKTDTIEPQSKSQGPTINKEISENRLPKCTSFKFQLGGANSLQQFYKTQIPKQPLSNQEEHKDSTSNLPKDQNIAFSRDEQTGGILIPTTFRSSATLHAPKPRTIVSSITQTKTPRKPKQKQEVESFAVAEDIEKYICLEDNRSKNLQFFQEIDQQQDNIFKKIKKTRKQPVHGDNDQEESFNQEHPSKKIKLNQKQIGQNSQRIHLSQDQSQGGRKLGSKIKRTQISKRIQIPDPGVVALQQGVENFKQLNKEPLEILESIRIEKFISNYIKTVKSMQIKLTQEVKKNTEEQYELSIKREDLKIQQPEIQRRRLSGQIFEEDMLDFEERLNRQNEQMKEHSEVRVIRNDDEERGSNELLMPERELSLLSDGFPNPENEFSYNNQRNLEEEFHDFFS